MKLVCGIGISDKGKHLAWVNGLDTKEYKLWHSVLTRCKVSGYHQTKQPAYIGCSAHQDFIKFQDFAEWCQTQIGFGKVGYALDKDILVQGNKVYGPDTCCFVPQSLNNLLSHNKSNKGNYPVGVSWNKSSSKYQAEIRIENKPKFLGKFDTPDDAHAKYKIAKLAEIHRQAHLYQTEIDPRVYDALMWWKI